MSTPAASYQLALLDATRQGPQRGAQHPGWQPYCTCCAVCAATAAKLRRLDGEERDTDGGDAHRERHERRLDDADRAITDARRGTAYGS